MDDPERRITMPLYEYKCNDCGKEFTLVLNLKDYEEGKAECSTCKSKNIKRLLGTFFATTSKKS